MLFEFGGAILKSSVPSSYFEFWTSFLSSHSGVPVLEQGVPMTVILASFGFTFAPYPGSKKLVASTAKRMKMVVDGKGAMIKK